ncbi:hypothetical protein [Lactobacillus taiwanensis]|nr:hypothetical protein [Lactobacillus taiwanensis]
MHNWIDWRVRPPSNSSSYCTKHSLGALGTFIIRVAIAYTIIKRANHKD